LKINNLKKDFSCGISTRKRFIFRIFAYLKTVSQTRFNNKKIKPEEIHFL